MIGSKLRFFSLLLQKVQLKTSFCDQGLRFFFRCHGRIRYKKKQFESSEIEKVAYKRRDIKGQVAHRLRGTWGLEGDNGLGATKVVVSTHFKLHVPYHDDGRQARLRPSLDGTRRPLPVRLPSVRRLSATGLNGTVTDPSIRLRRTRWAALGRSWMITILIAPVSIHFTCYKYTHFLRPGRLSTFQPALRPDPPIRTLLSQKMP